MRRTSIALGCLLALSLAAPAAAGKPMRGCGNGSFELMNYAAFRALSVSVGVPEELLNADHQAHWDNNIDKNGDGLACIKDLPDNAGTLFGWIFNAIDNTANR